MDILNNWMGSKNIFGVHRTALHFISFLEEASKILPSSSLKSLLPRVRSKGVPRQDLSKFSIHIAVALAVIFLAWNPLKSPWPSRITRAGLTNIK